MKNNLSCIDEKEINLLTIKSLKNLLNQIPREVCDDKDIAQLDKINKWYKSVIVITGAVIAGLTLTLIYNIVNVAKK